MNNLVEIINMEYYSRWKTLIPIGYVWVIIKQ